MSRSGRVAFVIAAALALVLLLVLIQFRGPSPVGANAPADQFSAVRAMAEFHSTIGGTVPHPIGSDANAAIRERIVAAFTQLGYDTVVRRTFACNGRGICGNVENIVARPPGQSAGSPESPGVRGEQALGPAVAVVAHYDSVPAGPGASDDGTSVASILEIARAVRTERFEHPILFLVDDGEEAGLLGAEAFVASAGAKVVGAVVNLEARGTSGPSYLFETSSDNRRFISRITSALPRPATSSLFPAVYDLLPNDTDLTVFKRAGLAGVNFAYIHDVENYHTPHDDVRHVDLRSVQHQGENALAAVRAFATADVTANPAGNDVWLDILGFFVVSWPSSASLAVAIVSLLIAFVAAALVIRDGEARLREVAAGVLLVAASIVCAFGLGFLIAWLSSLRSGGLTFVAHPVASIIASWLAGIVATLAIAAGFRRRAECAGLICGTTVAWNVLAVAVCVILPGGSYLFLIPAVLLSIVAIVRGMEIVDDEPGLIVCAIVAAIVWFPLAAMVYDSLGSTSLPVIALALALVTTTFAPLFAVRGRALAVAFACTAAVVVIALIVPPVSSTHLRRIPITWIDDGVRAQWVSSATTGPMRAAVSGFAQTDARHIYPWAARDSKIFTAPAARLAIAPVTITRTASIVHGKRVLTLRVVSQRNASRVQMLFRTADTVDSIRIDGHALPPLTRGRAFLAPRWHVAAVRGGSTMDVEITTRGHAPVEAIASDMTFGLPPEGRALAAARNASQAITSDDGDVMVTMRKAVF